MTADPARLVPIPGLADGDVAVIPGILKSNGLFSRVVTTTYGDAIVGEVLVWESDLPKVRRALARYRVRGAGDALVEIPW